MGRNLQTIQRAWLHGAFQSEAETLKRRKEKARFHKQRASTAKTRKVLSTKGAFIAKSRVPVHNNEAFTPKRKGNQLKIATIVKETEVKAKRKNKAIILGRKGLATSLKKKEEVSLKQVLAVSCLRKETACKNAILHTPSLTTNIKFKTVDIVVSNFLYSKN